MANQYKENGQSQPGIGYYVERADGTYTPVLTTERMYVTRPDGQEEAVSKVVGRLHWMDPSVLGKSNPVPGCKRFIEVHLVPNRIEPRYDPTRRN